MAQKQYIKDLYENEEVSLREIARRTNLSFQTVQKYAYQEDWSQEKLPKRKGVYTMALAVKSNYINPLQMAGQSKHWQAVRNPAARQGNKADSVQNLQMERQALQNQILLMKGSSDSAGVSEDAQKLLDQRLEEVSDALQKAKSEWGNSPCPREPNAFLPKARFDSYVPGQTQGPGLYQMQRDMKTRDQMSIFPFSR